MDPNQIEAPENANATHEALAALKKDLAAVHEKVASNRGWDVLKIVLPVLLTTLLGFWVWYTQAKIQNKVDENNRVLQTRLALTQDFYKLKLAAYVDISTKIAEMRKWLDSYIPGDDTEVAKQASDSIRAVNDLRTLHALFLSEELKKELGKLWDCGIDRMTAKDADEDPAMQRINAEIAELEERMREDLQTKEIGRLPEQQHP